VVFSVAGSVPPVAVTATAS